MYLLDSKQEVEKVLLKLDRHIRKRVQKKINQILKNPYHFKPLKKPLQHKRRVHIGLYILTYSINEKRRIVTILDYSHHDEAYR